MFNYKQDYNPRDYYGELSDYYIEVGRACYQQEGLKDSKVDILVYSAIVAATNGSQTDTVGYPSSMYANRLGMDVRGVRRSIDHLEELGLLSVNNKGSNQQIKVLIDLRINAETGKKNTIKVFDRIFYYPLIKPSMVHVYSYYWGLSNMEQYREKCTVDLDTVANTLGMSRATVKRLLEQMSDLGLLEVQENKYRKNAPHVKLLVDFSKEQPEETEYLAEKKWEYEEAIERWVQEQEQKEREMGLLEELDELDEWEREMKKPPLSWDEDEEFPF